MDIKKIVKEELEKRMIKEDHLNTPEELQNGLATVISETCRCLKTLNPSQFAADFPDQAREMYLALEKVQELCLNAPLVSKDQMGRVQNRKPKPDFLRP